MRSSKALVIYVGLLHEKISIGSTTSFFTTSGLSGVLDFLAEETLLHNLYAELITLKKNKGITKKYFQIRQNIAYKQMN